MPRATRSDLLKFVERVGRMTHEGEPWDQENSEGKRRFEMSSEDAIATVNELILEARVLLGTAHTCADCHEVVAFTNERENGDRVCQSCYES